ncbi:MAG TPA: superoxide dismutase [Gemmatimonadaceae bacterium]|jgi:superoxide dismutase, Fe-Mn family|nr:superoxide dismutase [Gemmatimonadaceae bacterium]
MAFTLPALPYDFAALEPSIDARTMEIHHDKHHAGYVNNLNAALEKAPELQSRSLDDLLQNLDSVPESIRTAVRNNAGGHWNHSMFWEIMSPKGGGEPTGKLADAIKKSFGDFATFQTQFADAAAKRFGSGWAWLVKDGTKLSITSTPNQDTPVMEKKHPILGVDVWEHAYYLKYQNKRPDYVKAWWDVVNWPEVGRRFEA